MDKVQAVLLKEANLTTEIEVNGKIQKRFEFVKDESSKEVHIDALKSNCTLFEATSDQAEVLNGKMDKFNANQLSFARKTTVLQSNLQR